VIYRSPRPSIEIPNVSLADFVLARACARGTRPALVDSVTGRCITYARLPELVDRAAAGFARLGLGKGDVCAIFSQNTPEYPIAMLALARLGAIATTASPLYTKHDLVKQLTDSRARILLTSAALAQTWREAASEVRIEHVITFEDAQAPVVGGNAAGARERALEDAIRQAVTLTLADIVDPQTRAAQAKTIKAIEAKARSFVPRYRTLEEGEVAGMYNIRLEVEVDDIAL